MNTTESTDTLETTDTYSKYDDYKDSGVEWVREIPSHWESVKFAYMITNSNAGEVIDKTHWGEGDELLYSCRRTPIQSSFSDFPDDRRATEKDLLVTRNGTPYVHLPEEGDIYTNVVQRLEIAEDLDRRFGWYCLSQAAHTLQGVGDIIESFNLSTWRNLRVPLPPRDEQRAIAAYLDRETERIDALIEKKEQLIELLEEKRSVLISRVVTKGLDEDVEMQDSGLEWLGEIPAEWGTAKLKFLSPEITVGIVVKPTQHYKPNGVPALRSLNVTERGLDSENLVYIGEADNKELQKSRIWKDDLVSVRTGQPGTTAVVDERFDGANCIDLIIIRRSEAFESDYLSYFLNSIPAKGQYGAGSEGAIQQHFNVDTAKNLKTPVPPIEEQRRIARSLNGRTSKLDSLINRVENGIDRLKEYRTALISAGVTGQIDVRKKVSEEAHL